MTAELDGYFADSALTVPVPPVAPEVQRLCDFTKAALARGIAAARAGHPISDIGRATEAEARRGGFRIIRELTGHGVGRHVHEEPTVPAFYHPSASRVLKDGLVITIEPFLTPRSTRIVTGDDGWTLKSANGTLSAQFEHTIVVNGNQPLIVTVI